MTNGLANLDWDAIEESLTERGFAHLPKLLSPDQCAGIIELYDHADLFRSRIDMAQYRFGRGEYQYFAYPLPPLVEELRHALYSRLERIANQWAEMFDSDNRFPGTLTELLARCHEAGQARPTPLVLRYREGDFNCLHQDIYGAIAFPFQVVCYLSQPGTHYGGGEFLLTEQVPRAQTMGRVFQPDQGDAMVITTRHRPGRGKRGVYRINVKHGVSPVAWGQRQTLGIIFHDAE
jgi:hypothetical protein